MGDTLSLLFVDVAQLPQTAFGMVQVLFMGIIYGCILFWASGMISGGSELLLLIPPLAGIVGSVVLPVLGAVPDGAIVLFSGLGSIEAAQEQLSVGVGALAGSTIMLLTLPFAGSILAGRVSMENGKPAYNRRPKLRPPGAWLKTAVGSTPAITKCGRWMLLTAVSYLIIQGPAFGFKCGTQQQLATNQCSGISEKWFALAGLVVCIGLFCGYLYDAIKSSASDRTQADKIAELRKSALSSGLLSLKGLFALGGGERQPLLGFNINNSGFRNTVQPFFRKYDRNKDNKIDSTELACLMRDLNENPTTDELKALMAEMDKDGNGAIDFNEFVEVLAKVASQPDSFGQVPNPSPHPASSLAASDLEDPEDGDDDEDDAEVPSDLASLPAREQQKRLLIRSGWMMGCGTFVVLLFSDPMVSVLSEVGNRIGISPFYISFVLAPLASNASELIASFTYAAKKTEKTISISFSALYGAATMNNTFCLAIFLALVFFRGLAWEFSAETLSILAVQVVVYYFSTKRVLPALSSTAFIFAIYPISILLVVVLEGVVGLD